MAASTAKAKRASTPRKATKRALPNGAAVAAPVVAAHSENGSVAQPPELFVPREGTAAIEDEKPRVPGTFTFIAQQGAIPIIVPAVTEWAPRVTKKFLRRIYFLDPLYQSFEWLKLAGVPEDVCEQIDALDRETSGRFWKQWFQNAADVVPKLGEGPPGES